jgi:ABC-type multidrug transport system ATPase subunit
VFIGRDPSCNIVLASRFVSSRHARIDPDGLSHRIADLGSMNGLLRAGRRLPANSGVSLTDGDVLRIGDPTTGAFVTLTYRNPQGRGAAAPLRLPLPAERNSITLGRAGCDVDLPNPMVSSRHALIERAGSGHAIRDLDSMNGTFVDGQRVKYAPLRRGAVIQIGPFKLVYDGAGLARPADQRGGLRLDGRQLSQRVGGGRFILRDVSISVAPREFVALVGGSGTGKSTLMKALAGYAEASHGQVLVNGDDFYDHLDAYRSLLGYVPQDDTLHKELPAGLALAYAARLRLPADTSGAEIEQRIARVLEDVDMTAHRKKRIDQLSGGQRKRVSIAAELLADPSLFFLDEPTSGLDPGLEKKMMYTLRRLADTGRTIVLVTHATANISQCDHVAFMAEGRMVFFGPPSEALSFFRVDSGDFADIYTKLEGLADPSEPERWAVAEADLGPELEAFRRANAEPPSLAELWEMRFRASPAYQLYVARRVAEAPDVAGGERGARPRRPRGVSSLGQLSVLSRRYLRLLFQDRKNLLILLLQAPVIGYLMTLVARSDALVGPRANSIDAKTVLFMLSTVAVWFGIINAAREITKESAIYRRERLAGLRVGPYILSKLVVLTLLVLVQSASLLAVVNTDVRFPSSGRAIADGWTELFVTTALTSLTGLAVGLCISASARTPDRAISFVPLALIPQILFSGVLFPFGSGVTTTRVLSWFTVSRWALDAYGTTVNLGRIPPPERTFPSEYTFTRDNLLLKWQILGGYTAVCFVLACLLLSLRDRER